MHTFFHGWRRKAGVVTLVMALALVLIDAKYGSAPWAVHWHQSEPVSQEWHGIGMSTQSSGVGIAVPNWSVAIALTLLSAYLILWKPRKRASQISWSVPDVRCVDCGLLSFNQLYEANELVGVTRKYRESGESPPTIFVPAKGERNRVLS